MIKVKRVLVSVSDKAGLLDFGRGLQRLGIEILSTGGTAKALRAAGIPVKDVSEYTGFPEILDGRVKTLHPKIHGALLALRNKSEHIAQLKEHHIEPIDMVVINLYPFEKIIAKKNVTLEEALENLDIGGPAMLRSAAKNFKNVAVVCSPRRYEEVLKELDVNSGILSDRVLVNLALEVFEVTSRYDRVISEFLNSRLKTSELTGFPKELNLRFAKIQDLRYGENPHQNGAFYRDLEHGAGLPQMKQRHGKELSFNNILDLNAALSLLLEFKDPTAVIIKHNNPTGIAQDSALLKAYQNALKCDPVSAFGGIIGLNRKVDRATATAILKSGFMECIVAPGYEAAAFKLLSAKKNLRLLELPFEKISVAPLDFKKVHGGLLLQESDDKQIQSSDVNVVTKIKPTKQQLDSLMFAWKAAHHIKSNAIVLVKGTKTVGIGCGQTSRVESVAVAVKKAGANAKNAVLASDGFLPKTDNVVLAARAGIKAIIQPGGSILDKDVIREADKAKIAMVTTGVRHFKH
jgi:phosphoribosylaminoimidazolecarboxamide formyltransferase/IMP cyclohydrolase